MKSGFQCQTTHQTNSDLLTPPPSFRVRNKALSVPSVPFCVRCSLLEQSLSDVAVKRSNNHCTPTFVMAGYEEHPILGHIVVSQSSATRDATELRGFPKNHIELSKPGGRDDGVYQWVDAAIKSCLGGGYQCPTEQICTQLGDFR